MRMAWRMVAVRSKGTSAPAPAPGAADAEGAGDAVAADADGSALAAADADGLAPGVPVAPDVYRFAGTAMTTIENTIAPTSAAMPPARYVALGARIPARNAPPMVGGSTNTCRKKLAIPFDAIGWITTNSSPA